VKRILRRAILDWLNNIILMLTNQKKQNKNILILQSKKNTFSFILSFFRAYETLGDP